MEARSKKPIERDQDSGGVTDVKEDLELLGIKDSKTRALDIEAQWKRRWV